MDAITKFKKISFIRLFSSYHYMREVLKCLTCNETATEFLPLIKKFSKIIEAWEIIWVR